MPETRWSTPKEIQVSGIRGRGRVVVNIQCRWLPPSPRNAGLSTRFMVSSQSRNRWPRAGQNTARVTSATANGASPHHHGIGETSATGAGGGEGATAAGRDRERFAAHELGLTARAATPSETRGESGR